jgi:hypothetical protein
MSSGPLNLKGTPNTDNSDTVRLLLYCGGSGGGNCVEPLGISGVMLAYRVPKFITYNRKIVFENKEFLGIQIFTDGGPAGFCDHSISTTEVPFWIGLTADGSEDIETAAKRGYELSGDPPYDIEFPADLCPQPTDPAWENIVYVAVYWGNPAFMSGNVPGAIIEQSLDLKKHDKDTKQ